MTLLLGNLLPDQEAHIRMDLIEETELVAGSYSYKLPSWSFPNYKKNQFAAGEGDEQDPTPYIFSFNAEVTTSSKLVYFSAP